LFLVYVFHHPVAANIILVATTNAEYAAFVSDHRSTELRYIEIIFQVDSMRDHLIHVKKVDIFGSPLKVVNELARAVAFLENKRIL
jgi:hypothetical protein